MLTKGKLFIIFVFVLVIALGLIFTFRDTLRSALIVPLLYISWLSKLVYASIDQAILWIFTLLIIILILGLSGRRPHRLRTQEVTSEGTRIAASRLRHWMVLTRYAFGDRFFRDRFSIELRKIILGVLAERAHITPEQVETRLELGEIQIPLDVKHHLSIDRLPTIYQQPTFRDRMRNFIKSFYKITALDRRTTTRHQMENDRQMEVILTYIEEQLEIKHDHQHT